MLPFAIIRQTHRGLIERFGRYNRFATPGFQLMIPIIEEITEVNITEQMIDSGKQQVITGDNLNTDISAQIYFKIKDDEESVKKSEYGVSDYIIQTTALARTTLRNIIGKYDFKTVNSQRAKLNAELAKEMEESANKWGIDIIRTEIKEIDPPADVQETMNTVIKANNTKTAAIDYATATETEADGKKRALIKEAEGLKQKAILEAEGFQKKTVLMAQGNAEAITRIAEADATAIKVKNEAIQKYFTANPQIYEQLQAVKQTIGGETTKYIIPQNTPLADLIAGMLLIKGAKK